MDSEEQSSDPERTKEFNVLARIVQVVAGVLVATSGVLTMCCAAVMFDWPDPAHATMIALLGLVVEAGALFTFIKAADLLFGRRTQGGLIGATGMRIIAVAYFVMLAAGLVAGDVGRSPIPKIVATVGGLLFFSSLLAISRRRAAERRRQSANRFRA